MLSGKSHLIATCAPSRRPLRGERTTNWPHPWNWFAYHDPTYSQWRVTYPPQPWRQPRCQLP